MSRKAAQLPETAAEHAETCDPADEHVHRTVSTPEPVSSGSYALYHTPGGGIHLVYRAYGADADQHLDIPPFIVTMARKASAGAGDLGPFGALLPPMEG